MPIKYCNIDTSKAVERAFEESNIGGDYYEFGLFQGKSFYTAIQSAKDNVVFFGFDSFQGLPACDGIDGEFKFTKHKYSCSKEVVVKNLEPIVDWSRTFLINGWYNETLKHTSRHAFGKAKIVLIDCDLYKSTVPVLKFIEPHLQTGTILLFDDWKCFYDNPDRGEQKATNEFLENNCHIKLSCIWDFGKYGKAFIVTNKEDKND